MFRLWAKIFKENRLIKDVVICNDQEDTRTHKDFKRHSKTRFTKDSFIEHIDFDYLEIQVIEED